MSGDISIDLGSALPYLVDKFSGWFGKDAATQERLQWFAELQRVSHYEASQVQCIGMHRPVPIKDVYQPTRLQLGESKESLHTIPVAEFLKESKSTIVKAGPGYGKTTFLHYVFISQVQSPTVLPVLISLRKSSSLDDLGKLLELAKEANSKQWKRERRLLLLVDGYDEIDIDKQKTVSELLMKFEALALGYFYLTCRKFYDIFYLKTRAVSVAPFDEADQLRFTKSFLDLFGVNLDATTMISDLRLRRMDEFLAHPLLLALVCIIKSNPTNPLSNSILELASNAVDTLSFKWDMEKGVARPTATPLSGKNRIDLLSWIAFKMEERAVSGTRAHELTTNYLAKLQWKDVDAVQVLIETAKFYGIFVPYETGWVYVHKVLHDFLAARYWVSTGTFRAKTVKEWNARAAYAACLQADATDAIKEVLKQMKFSAFAEMLMNSPAFDQSVIAAEFVTAWRMGAADRKKAQRRTSANNPARSVDLDYFGYASSKFLDAVISEALRGYTDVDEAVVTFAVLEIASRKEALDSSSYEQCAAHFKEDHKFEGLHRGQWREALLKNVDPRRHGFNFAEDQN